MRLRRIFGSVFLLVLLGVAFLFCKKPIEKELHRLRPESLTLTPEQSSHHTQSISRYHLGFPNLISALMWVRLLQTASHQKVAPGRVSWEYTQLRSIASLDPDFDRAYSFGSVFLTVFLQDHEGAKLILERWARRNPTRWQPHYLLGFHQYHNLGDFTQGAQSMLKAAALPGAPGWLTALGVRLFSEASSLMQSLQLALEVAEGIQEGEGRVRILKRIRVLNYYIQKQSWIDALAQYEEKYQRGPAGIESLKPYWVSNQRQLASLNDTVEVSPEIAAILRERFQFSYDPASQEFTAPESASLEKEKLGIHKRKKKAS